MTTLVVIGIASGIFLLVGMPNGFGRYGDTILGFVRNHREWAIPIIGVLAFGESIAFVSLVLPFWALLVGIGAFLTNTGTGFAPIWIAASVGAALGDWLSFWLGYHYHDRIARMWPLNRHPDLLSRGHNLFERWGFWAIWIARFTGPLRASVPIVAGAVQMSPWRFQIANWGSAFLWAGVLLALGDTGGKVLEYIYRLF